MNYGELKTAVAQDTHRTNDTATVALIPRFVRECEGLIRRELRGYPLAVTLDETDRVSGGMYALPARTIEIRSLRVVDRDGDGLIQMPPDALRRARISADPFWFAQYGNGQIEIRGVPATDTEFDLLYFGEPAPFASDTDENDLLTDHETLYISGAKFFLYQYTQDRELAADAFDIFRGVIMKLNELYARKTGGASVAGAYNFAGGSSY